MASERPRPNVRRNPPHVSVSDFVRRAKGRSSRNIEQEFEHIRKRYWEQRFWLRALFQQCPATSPMTSSCVIWIDIPQTKLQPLRLILPASAGQLFR
nr:transposase [Sphingomonas paeninsulae]